MESPFKVQLLPSECVLRMVEFIEKHHLSDVRCAARARARAALEHSRAP